MEPNKDTSDEAAKQASEGDKPSREGDADTQMKVAKARVRRTKSRDGVQVEPVPTRVKKAAPLPMAGTGAEREVDNAERSNADAEMRAAKNRVRRNTTRETNISRASAPAQAADASAANAKRPPPATSSTGRGLAKNRPVDLNENMSTLERLTEQDAAAKGRAKQQTTSGGVVSEPMAGAYRVQPKKDDTNLASNTEAATSAAPEPPQGSNPSKKQPHLHFLDQNRSKQNPEDPEPTPVEDQSNGRNDDSQQFANGGEDDIGVPPTAPSGPPMDEEVQDPEDKPALDSYLVEATLVTSTQDMQVEVEENQGGNDPDAIGILVMAEKSQAINFRSRKVMAGIFLLILLVGGLVVGLVVSQAGSSPAAPALEQAMAAPTDSPSPTTLRPTEKPTLQPTVEARPISVTGDIAFDVAFADTISLWEPTNEEVFWLLVQVTTFYYQSLPLELPTFVSWTTELLSSRLENEEAQYPFRMIFQMDARFLGEAPKDYALLGAMRSLDVQLVETIVEATAWGDLFNGLQAFSLTLLEQSNTEPTPVPLTLPPTPQPNNSAVLLDEFALDFGLFEGTNQRIPTQQEIVAVLIKTNEFYEVYLNNTFPNLVSFDTFVRGTKFHKEYEFSSVNFRIVCGANIFFQAGSTLPALENISSAMDTLDYTDFIISYLWETELGNTSLFYDTQSIQFTAKEGLFEEETTTLTFPPTQAPNENTIPLDWYTLEFGACNWGETGVPTEQEVINLLIQTSEFYTATLESNFTNLHRLDTWLLNMESHTRGNYPEYVFWRFNCSANFHFENGTAAPPKDDILLVMQNANYGDLVYRYIHFDSTLSYPGVLFFNNETKFDPGAYSSYTCTQSLDPPNYTIPLTLPPTQAPNENTLILESFTLDYGLFNDVTERDPTENEVVDLLIQTNLFYEKTLGAVYSNLDSWDVFLVNTTRFGPEEPYFLRLHCGANIYFQLGTEAPALSSVVNVMEASNYVDYITNYTWLVNGIFTATQQVYFDPNLQP